MSTSGGRVFDENWAETLGNRAHSPTITGMGDKSSVDLFKQELKLLNEYVDRVDAFHTEFLVTHCQLLLTYARAADSEATVEIKLAA